MNQEIVFCIDGSGNKKSKEANLKRPIYELSVSTAHISRPILERDETVFDYFCRRIDEKPANTNVLIAADLAIGLPESYPAAFESINADSFLTWITETNLRLKRESQHWREGLIAANVKYREPLKPFVSIKKGDKASAVQEKRHCDTVAGGGSIYAVDNGGKQVGKASLQFWFEVLIPLRERYTNRIAVWPFEPLDDRDIVIGECYPAECQRHVYGNKISKRNSMEVARALCSLNTESNRSLSVSTDTWIYAASSEDEFDMFTTAVAFCESFKKGDDLFWHPDGCQQMEGWMLGLKETERPAKKKPTRKSGTRNATGKSKVPVGETNRNNQENLGPSGRTGPKGPLVRLQCRSQTTGGPECGHIYETNPQEVFHKKCPVCQGGR